MMKKMMVLSAVLALLVGPVWGVDFDLKEDVKILQKFFDQQDDRSPEERMYQKKDRRYVHFDVTSRKKDVLKTLSLLKNSDSEKNFGTRIFHKRFYKVTDQYGVNNRILKGLGTDTSKLFVRSSTKFFLPDYWALYELRMSNISSDDEDEKENNISVENSDNVSLFFGVFYKEIE